MMSSAPGAGAGAGTGIKAVVVELFNVPLAEVLVDAKHGSHTHFELVLVTVRWPRAVRLR